MIIRLAHVELAVGDLAAAALSTSTSLGFTVATRTAALCSCAAVDELDVWSLTLTAAARPGLLHLGFRVESAEALERSAPCTTASACRCSSRAGEPSPTRDGRCVPALPTAIPGVLPRVSTNARSTGVPTAACGCRCAQPTSSTAFPPCTRPRQPPRALDPDTSLGYWRDELGFSVSERSGPRTGAPASPGCERRRMSHEVAVGRLPPRRPASCRLHRR